MEDIFDKAIAELKKAIKNKDVDLEPVEFEPAESSWRLYVERALFLINSSIERIKEFKTLIYGERRPASREERFVLVEILEEIPAFVGPDGEKEYGPYKPGDFVFLPREAAYILERAGKARRVRSSSRSRSLGINASSKTCLASARISSSLQRREM